MPHRVGKWKAVNEGGRMTHLMPLADTTEHLIQQCPCKPDLDFYPVLDGEGDERNFGIVTHHAFDHREDNLNHE